MAEDGIHGRLLIGRIIGRQLDEEGAKMGAEQTHGVHKVSHRFMVAATAVVGNGAGRFGAKQKALAHALRPTLHRGGRGRAVKSRIYLHAIKKLAVIGQPPLCL